MFSREIDQDLKINQLEFVSGNFFDITLPKEKRYLLKYFKTSIEKQFLQYFYIFNNVTYFCLHTGIPCTERWLYKMKQKLLEIEAAHEKSRQVFDIEKLALIESGKWKGKKKI